MSKLDGFTAIASLLTRIKETGNEWPKVRLTFGDKPLTIALAGAKSRTPGHVVLTDGGKYPSNTYYGTISPQGTLTPASAAKALPQEDKAALWSLLTAMRDGDAEKVFAEHGHRFGVCCLCGRELSNPESVELGIGPICRERAFG